MIFRKLSLLVATLFATFCAQADSAGLRVTGTITPGACELAFGGDGAANYGKLSIDTVRSYPIGGTFGNVYLFPNLNVPFSVVCTSPTRFALAIHDNLSASRMVIDGNDFYRFGLVDENGITLGAYEVNSSALTINGGQVPAAVLGAPNATTFWLPGDVSNRFSDRWQNGYTFGYVTSADHYEPDALSGIQGTLTFNAFVERARMDALTSRVQMRGSGTVTLTYL